MKIKLLFSLILILLIAIIYNYSISANQAVKIDIIMQYAMPEIVKRCQKDFNYADQDMVILEREFKRFLILTDLNQSLGMFSKDVDNLWHSFILFTKEYANFCDTHFGHFIHHAPNTSEDTSLETLSQNHKQYLQFLASYRGLFNEEPHNIWFLDMCEK